jgi:subtilase family serine protease
MMCFVLITVASEIHPEGLYTNASASVIHPEGLYTNGWSKYPRPVGGDLPVTFTIVIKERNIDAVKRIALDASDPAFRNYGKFLSQERLDSLTAPTMSDASAVTDWLDANGVSHTKRSASNIKVTTSVENASRMLNTRFHEVINNEHGQSVVRATSYSLPDKVHQATRAIFGLHGLPLPPSHPLIVASTTTGSSAKVDPNVIASTYKIGGVKPTGSVKNRQAVAEFQSQYMSSKDLACHPLQDVR